MNDSKAIVNTGKGHRGKIKIDWDKTMLCHRSLFNTSLNRIIRNYQTQEQRKEL